MNQKTVRQRTYDAEKCQATVKRYSGRKGVNEECGEPAHYWWASLSHPARMMAMCKTHGEEIAGNYMDELTPISTKV